MKPRWVAVVWAPLLVSAAAGTAFGATRASPKAAESTAHATPAPDTTFRHAAAWDTLTGLQVKLRWAAVESLATSILARLERASGVDSMDYARATIAFGQSRLRRNLFADGRAYEAMERGIGIRTRHAPKGDAVLAAAHVAASLDYTDGGKVREAIEHGETALRVLRAAPALDTVMAAKAENAIATAQMRLGQPAEARAAFERALALREAHFGRDSPLLVPTLATYGELLARIGEFDSSRELLTRAVRLSAIDSAARTSDFMEGSIARLSTLERRVGNLAESVDLAQRAFELARGRVGDDAVPTAQRRIVLAYRLEDFGDHRAAIELYERALPVMEARLGPDHPQVINARLALAEDLLSVKDTVRSARELAVIKPLLAHQQSFASSNENYLRAIEAMLERRQGRLAAARETLELAIRSEQQKHSPIGDYLATLYVQDLATVLSTADSDLVGRLGLGVDRLADSTRVRSTLEWIDLVGARARAEARAGRRDAAWNHALVAEELARRRLVYSLQALPDRRALQYAQSLSAPCELLVDLAKPDRPEELETAWDRIVRWRGLVGHEIARRRLPARSQGDTALAAVHDRWLQAQRQLAQLVVSGAAHPDDPTSAERFEAARHDAEEAERHYVRRASGAVAIEDSVTLARVLARLGPEEALIGFATGGDGDEPGEATLGAFVATGPHPPVCFVPLGQERELESRIRAWVRALAEPPVNPGAARRQERACRQLGQRVRATVWEPIARRLGSVRRVYLVPEGAVAELPWLALPANGQSYLAEGSLTLRVLNAERDLLPPSDSARGNGLLAVGGPDYDAAGGAPAPAPSVAMLMRARTWPCAGEPVALPSLPAARAEAEDIVRRWPASAGRAQLLEGAAADEARFKLEAPGHAVIHVATHGVVVEDTCAVRAGAGTRGLGGVETLAARRHARHTAKPVDAPEAAEPRHVSPWLGRQVWLALAGANRPPSEARDENEGLLTAEEITTLDLRGTDWVVLSACQSGVAPVWEHEGVLGMRRAFALAGARAVIASQWPVADEATREWMTALYAARAHGLAAGAAVQSACHAVLEARRRAHRSTVPFYWAAFSATED